LSEDIKNFLSQKRAGGNFDSQGTFTLDQSAIARRLAEYGLGTQANCLLRLVQIALSGGAQKVTVVFGIETVEISLWSWGSESALIHKVDRPLFILLSGCLHSGFHQVLVSSGRRRWTLDKTFKVQKARGSFRNGATFLFKGPYAQDIRLEMSRRLQGCPAPVYLALERINRTRSSGRMLLELEVQSRVASYADSLWVQKEEEHRKSSNWWSLVEDSATRYIDLEDGILTENRLSTRWQTLLYAKRNGFDDDDAEGTGPLKTIALLHVPLKARSPETLYFVKHGVVVGAVEAQIAPTLGGFVSAAGLDTDLSGLKLVHNRKLEARLADLKSTVETLKPKLSKPGLAKLRERLL
jgi:hypothetical protein